MVGQRGSFQVMGQVSSYRFDCSHYVCVAVLTNATQFICRLPKSLWACALVVTICVSALCYTLAQVKASLTLIHI